MAEQADAGDLKSSGGDTPCGFDSHPPHSAFMPVSRLTIETGFLFYKLDNDNLSNGHGEWYLNPKIVFMGSPEFALPALSKLVENYDVQGVITQPDKPAGRGNLLSPPPVKTLAEKLKIPCIQPLKLNDPQILAQIRAWQPDLIVVAAYGKILKPDILHFPPYGCLNIHASLLPRWRGAAPIVAAILAGDQETGVTIMKMAEGIDSGPILKQRTIPILDQDNTLSLSQKLSVLGADLLLETIPDYLNGECLPIPQNDSQATYAPMIDKNDGFLDFCLPAIELWRKIRAYNPWPGSFTTINHQRMIILEAQIYHQQPKDMQPGQTLILENMPIIVTSDKCLAIVTLQMAGKKPVSGKEFLNGFRSWGKITLPS